MYVAKAVSILLVFRLSAEEFFMVFTPSIRRAFVVAAALGMFIAGCGSGESNPTSSDSGGQTSEASDRSTVEEASAGTEAESAAPSAAPVAVTMAVQEGAASNLPMAVARDQGMFEAQGLEVEYIPLAGNALLPAITSGDVQFFSQAVQIVGTAIQQDVQLRFFCGGSDTNWTVVMAPTSSDLPSTADGATWQESLQSLEGSTLGVAALGATQENWARSLMNAAGMDEDSITLVPVGVGPSAIAALDGGQVDAILGYSFIKEQLLAAGDTEQLFAFDETGPDGLGDQMNTGMVADVAWLDANPDVAQRICAAFGEAMSWFQDPANETELRAILAGPDFGITDETVQDQIMSPDGVLTYFSPEVDCARLERAADFFVEFGTFQAEPVIDCETAVWSP